MATLSARIKLLALSIGADIKKLQADYDGFGSAAKRDVGVDAGKVPLSENVTAMINAAKTTIVQSQGQSETSAVSQKLFTDTVGDIGTALDAINGEIV